MKKKFIVFLLVAMVALALAGCSKGKTSQTGTYRLTQFMRMDVESAQNLYAVGGGEGDIYDMFILTLADGGKATFTVNGEDAELEYSIQDDTITLSSEGQSLEGTIKDNVITLSIEGIELELTKQ